MPTIRTAVPELLEDLEATLNLLGDARLAADLAEQEVRSRASFGNQLTQIELRPSDPILSSLPLRPAGKVQCLYLPIRGGSALVFFDPESRALGLEVTGRSDLPHLLDRAGIPTASRMPFG